MTTNNGIQELVQQLPLERLDAATRQMLDRSLAGSDPVALRAAVRQVAGELLQKGVLIRVAVEGASGMRGPLFLVRGSSQLVDLAALTTRRPEPAPAPDPPPTAAPAEPPVQARPADQLAALLEAMERAQDLAVGDPRADEPAVMVDRILTLLRGYADGVELHAQLASDRIDSEATDALLPSPEAEKMPFWLRHRRPGQSLWVPDASELPASLRRRLEDRPEGDLVTAVVPLFEPGDGRGEAGLLYVSAPPVWNAENLLAVARRLSAFVSRRWRCQRDVNRKVLTDSLTGIHNRAFFDSQFPLELERARRGSYPLTLVIGDLDNFKAINDTHGHQCGDLVLRAVARQLQSKLRRIDQVCRIGGEEFALLLPYTSVEEARDVLGRVVGRPFGSPCRPNSAWGCWR